MDTREIRPVRDAERGMVLWGNLTQKHGITIDRTDIVRWRDIE